MFRSCFVRAKVPGTSRLDSGCPYPILRGDRGKNEDLSHHKTVLCERYDMYIASGPEG